MKQTLRKLPLVCLCLSIVRLLMGQLRLSRYYLGLDIGEIDEKNFRIFRHIHVRPLETSEENCVFIVRFKFAKLSHKANKIASLLPMLLITGFPGFMEKMYAVDKASGYWQGLYEWKSKQHLESYKKSFVFRMMEKRVLPNSIKMIEFEKLKLDDYISHHKISANNF